MHRQLSDTCFSQVSPQFLVGDHGWRLCPQSLPEDAILSQALLLNSTHSNFWSCLK